MKTAEELLHDNDIFLGYRGSISHGTYIPPEGDPSAIDDIDLMGIFIAPLRFYFGFGRGFTGYQKEVTREYWIENYDIVSYEIVKFFDLLCKGNPNVMGLLFQSDEHILYKHPLWDLITSNRQIFFSKNAFHAFNGYAQSQLRKMTNPAEINQEVIDEIKKIDLELEFRRERYGNSHYPEFQKTTTQQLEEQRNKLLKHEGYMGDKRRKLVDKFGYDVKNAAHLIRLLSMGIEFMNTGWMSVDRTGIDAESLREIKTGKWDLEDINALALSLNEEFKEAFNKTWLPEKPDRKGAEELLVEIISEYLL